MVQSMLKVMIAKDSDRVVVSEDDFYFKLDDYLELMADA